MNSETTLRRRRDCSPYSFQELDRFRAGLLARREEVRRSWEELAESACRTHEELSNLPQHLGELASDTFDQSMAIDFLARAQMEMDEIQDALERIDVRSFGICEECGEPIPMSRLLAIPTARLCVRCKRGRER
jgi:DnaK suppressor protein